MDNRPIGVFDSGLGGLTAVRELAAQMPNETLIYFGDTGRVPYGGRSRDTIIRYARQDVAFLRTFDLKAVVVACGTVSATALPQLQAEQDIPVFGVVEPTARQAAEETRNQKIGLIATRATIRTGAYERAIARLDPAAAVYPLACPLFVPLVENGRTQPGDVVIETVAAEYLAPLKEAGVDTLVLGCTHYPLLREVIGGFMGPRCPWWTLGLRWPGGCAATCGSRARGRRRAGPVPAAGTSATPPRALPAWPPVSWAVRSPSRWSRSV